jgi:hypothetical protein
VRFLVDDAQKKVAADHNLGAIRFCAATPCIGPMRRQIFELLDEREGRLAPYLLVEKRKREDSLLLMCDASPTAGVCPCPTCCLCIQICDILHAAHQRNVVYLDHKILHYYWLADTNGISRSTGTARYHPNGLTPYDIHMDLSSCAPGFTTSSPDAQPQERPWALPAQKRSNKPGKLCRAVDL